MSQVKKLREFIESAKETISGQPDPNDTIELLRRIDAVLAEPIEPCQTCAVSKAFHDVAVQQRNSAWRENERLRQIVSECASAIGNGSFASPECSIEFMSKIPAEIAFEVGRLKGSTGQT
jgi:hypothetical protein